MPTDQDGNWLSYPDYKHKGWETIHQPFWAVMKVTGMTTGRSSKVVDLQDINTGKKYPMFVADLIKGIQTGTLDIKSSNGEGYITANWTGSKRGSNYGIKAVSKP